MEWKYVSLPRTKKFRTVPSAGKAMFTQFWVFNGPVLKHYQSYGQMVNSAWHCAMLEEELKPAIHSKQTNADKLS